MGSYVGHLAAVVESSDKDNIDVAIFCLVISLGYKWIYRFYTFLFLATWPAESLINFTVWEPQCVFPFDDVVTVQMNLSSSDFHNYFSWKWLWNWPLNFWEPLCQTLLRYIKWIYLLLVCYYTSLMTFKWTDKRDLLRTCNPRILHTNVTGIMSLFRGFILVVLINIVNLKKWPMDLTFWRKKNATAYMDTV